MKHAEIRWNPERQEWFCVRCGHTSDQILKKDAEAELELAEAELELFDCRLPVFTPGR